MSIYRLQCIQQAFNDLPEDRYTNTFHVNMGPDFDTSDVSTIATPIVDAFYTSLVNFTAAYVKRTMQLNVYNLSDPPPRVPLSTTFTIPESGVSNPLLPLEVAGVLGYRATLPHTGRRRNRMYIGPLNQGCMDVGSTSSFPQLTNSFRNAVITAAQTMWASWQTAVGGNPSEGWIVYSPTSSALFPIHEVYVDNEADTQRRRGYAPTGRTLALVDP